MDEKYQAALHKILKLANDNPEFGNELRKALGVSITADKVVMDIPASRDTKVDKIEKYLGLDFKVDTQLSTIDYSYITDINVQQQLISDNREMMRFRYGTRYHQIDFLEFCRFVQLQAEMLLNYFYELIGGGDIGRIKERIKKNNAYTNGIDSCVTVPAIPYNMKFWAYSNEFHLNKESGKNLNNVRQIRNDQSHRDPNKDTNSIRDCQAWLKENDMPLKQDGEVNWYEIKDNDTLRTKYKQQIEKSDKYKEYCFSLWCERKPFENIVSALVDLSNSVAANFQREEVNGTSN